MGVSIEYEYAISHYPASVSAGGSRQVTYFEVSKASIAAAGTNKGKRFDSISGCVHQKRIDAQHEKGKTVRTGMQQADKSLCWDVTKMRNGLETGLENGLSQFLCKASFITVLLF